MNKFKTFYFEKFKFDEFSLKANFFYNFDNKEFFVEEIDFSSGFLKLRDNIDIDIINNILFSIHISLGISYYKLFPTKELIVKSGFLSNNQITFWKKFYKNGLGEFLYINKIKVEKLFNFKNYSNIKYKKIEFNLTENSLVPVGGGKDSIVTIELLKKNKIDFDLFVFGKNDELKQNCSDISDKKILLIKRKLSKNLFNLNEKGYYNGHIPITGLIAFNMILVAYLYNYKYLILSNELSANSGNTYWENFNINHQYSKSLEFEKDFKFYIEENISKNIKYFSLLRGMYEFKIAKLFSELAGEYFNKFSSCNNNFKIKEQSKNEILGKYWCNNCSKCCFVYTILSGFLSLKELKNIFGEDLYENKKLEKNFRELLGISGIKPFECVGEKEEVILGMYKALANYENLPYILKIFKNEILNNLELNYLNNLEKKLLKVYNDDIIPKKFKINIFKNNLNEKN